MGPRLSGRAPWGRRLCVLLLVITPHASGCDSDPVELRHTVGALAAARTVVFQDGTDGYTGAADTELSQNAPTTNQGSATTASADGDDPSGSTKDAAVLLRWDTSTIPAGSIVQSVTLAVRVVDASTNSYPLFALRRGWSESAATWSLAGAGASWETAGAQGAADRAATALASIAAPATGTVTVSFAGSGVEEVQRWVDDPSENFGVILAGASNTNGLDIATRESATPSYRPALSVTYVPPSSGTGGAGGADQPDAAADFAPGGGAPGTGGTTSAGTSGTGGAPGSQDAPELREASGDPAVLFAVGDVGDCNTNADTETAKLLDGTSDPVALLGDIGYPNGSASDLANCFGQPWGRHKSRVRPAPGNHEYLTAGASAYFQYFGAAAGTAGKGYYSYDVGGWHVIAINSNCSNVSCSAGGAQEQWLRQDLAAHPAACTIAYWHHPRYNSGHHGSASNMTAIWKALMDFNADIVLTGHEHGYQRWKPMNESGGQVASGITEFIVGTGGTDLVAFSGSKPANVVVRDASTPGVLKLTLRSGAYDWKFLPIAGKTFTDQGTGTCH